MGGIEIPPYATNGKLMSDVNNVINISPCYCQLFNQNRRSSTIYKQLRMAYSQQCTLPIWIFY